MAANDRTEELIIAVTTDKQSFSRAKVDIEKLKEELERLSKGTDDSAKNAGKLNEELSKIARQRAIQDIVQQTIAAAQETGDWTGQLGKLNTELTKLGATDSEIASVSRSLANARKSAEATTTVASKMNTEFAKLGRQKQIDSLVKELGRAKKGTQEWEDALKRIQARLTAIGATDSEIAGVTQQIANRGGAKISPRLQAFGREVRALPAVPIPGAGALTTDALGKVTAALAGLPPVAAPVIISLAAVGAGFVALNAMLEGNKKAIDQAISGLQAYYDAQREGLTTEEVSKQLEELNRAIKFNSEELAVIVGSYDSAYGGLSDEIDRINSSLGDTKLVSPQVADGIKRILFALAQVTGTDDKAVARADELRAELNNLLGQYENLNSGIERGAFLANDLAKAEDELSKTRDDATQRIAQLEQQRADILQRSGQAVRDQEEDRNVRFIRENRDFTRRRELQEAAHRARLEQIDADGINRLEQLRQQGNDRIAQADKELAKINASIADVAQDFRDNMAEVDNEFMADELKAYDSFRKEIAKRDREFAKERVRLLEDINNDLLDLEMANDVSGFVQRQRQAEIELRRQAEDQSEKVQQENEAFQEERQIAAQRRAERIADLEAAANERRADLAEQLAERQAAKAQLIQDIADQLAAEKQRIADSRAATVAAFEEQKRLEDEERRIRLQDQRADDDRADLRRQNALNQQLADIDAKKNAEMGAVDALIAKVNVLKAAIATIQAPTFNSPGINSGGSFGTNSSYYGGVNSIFGAQTSFLNNLNKSSTSGGKPLYAFAEGSHGRLVDKPTLGLLGERPGWGDLVIPYPKSGGSPMGSMGGVTVQLSIGNLGVGDIASATQARAIAEDIATQLAGKVLEVTRTALHGREN